MSEFLHLFFEIILESGCLVVGQYFWWNITGRKGNFSHYLGEDKHHLRDIITGIIIVVLTILLVIKLVWPEMF